MPEIYITAFQSLVVDDVPLGTNLTNSEARLLHLLCTNPAVSTREHLLDQMYGGMDEPQVKVFDVFVVKLRKKLHPYSDAILTAWGRGWYFNKAYTYLPPITQEEPISIPQKLTNEYRLWSAMPLEQTLANLLSTEIKRLQELP